MQTEITNWADYINRELAKRKNKPDWAKQEPKKPREKSSKTQKDWRRTYYEKNREKLKLASKVWRENNREKDKATKKRYKQKIKKSTDGTE